MSTFVALNYLQNLLCSPGQEKSDKNVPESETKNKLFMFLYNFLGFRDEKIHNNVPESGLRKDTSPGFRDKKE